MSENIIEELEKFGLSQIEAKVYCAVLALEKNSVDNIAKRAKINRTSCYTVLERLNNSGLISSVKNKEKTVFKAAPPEKFLEILEEKKKSIENIIPNLRSFFETRTDRADIRFYEGKEGLKTVLNMILKEAKEVLIFGDGDSFKTAIPHWTQYYSDKRAEHDIKARIILRATSQAIDSAKSLNLKNSKKSELAKIRVLPEALVATNSGFDVYGNKTIFYSFEKELLAVVVESRIISQMMKTVFETMWNEAEKYNNTLLRG